MNPSQHPSWEAELMPYADDQLDPEQAIRIRAHIEACGECANAVGDAKRLSMRMADWQVEEAPDTLDGAVLSALKTRSRPSKFDIALRWFTRPRILALSFGGTGAVLLLAVFAGTLYLEPSLQPAETARVAAGTTDPSQEPAASYRSELSSQRQERQGQQGQQARQGEVQTFYLARPQAAREGVAPPAGPMVVRTVQLKLISKEFDAARARIEAVVRNANGYVDRMTIRSNPGSPKGLSATLRLPVDRLDTSLAELRQLGVIKEESQSSSDVTSQYVDLAARLSNGRNTEQRLLAVVRERTGSIQDVVAAEREVSRVREEIERMEAERQMLSNRVQYATVQVELAEEYRAEVQPSAPSAGNRLRNAAIQGYRDAIESVMRVLLSVLSYGPTVLVAVALLGPVAYAAWRNRRRLLHWPL